MILALRVILVRTQSDSAEKSFGSMVNNVYLLLLDCKPFEIPKKVAASLVKTYEYSSLCCVFFTSTGNPLTSEPWFEESIQQDRLRRC